METQADLLKTLLEWSGLFVRRSMRDFMHYTRSSGLSLAQMNVMMHLYYRGSSEVTHFVEVMQVSPAAASQLVERMVQQGLVSRVENVQDRRVRQVHLTEKGRQTVEQSISARQKWLESLVEVLDENQKIAVSSALKVLSEKAQNLEKLDNIT